MHFLGGFWVSFLMFVWGGSGLCFCRGLSCRDVLGMHLFCCSMGRVSLAPLWGGVGSRRGAGVGMHVRGGLTRMNLWVFCAGPGNHLHSENFTVVTARTGPRHSLIGARITEIAEVIDVKMHRNMLPFLAMQFPQGLCAAKKFTAF